MRNKHEARMEAKLIAVATVLLLLLVALGTLATCEYRSFQ